MKKEARHSKIDQENLLNTLKNGIKKNGEKNASIYFTLKYVDIEKCFFYSRLSL